MGHFLTTQGMRVVEFNDRGNIKYQREYVRGDEVDTSHMDEDRVKALVESGDLSTEDPNSEKSDDEALADEQTRVAATSGGPVGAEGLDAAGNPVAPTGEPPAPVEGEGSGDTSGDGGDGSDEHDVDQYDEMDYATLKAEAGKRSLSQGGSAEDLRARLREDDKS